MIVRVRCCKTLAGKDNAKLRRRKQGTLTCWLWWKRTPKMKSASRNMASMSQRWGLRQPAQHRRGRPAAAGAPGDGLAGIAKLLMGTGMVMSWILREARLKFVTKKGVMMGDPVIDGSFACAPNLASVLNIGGFRDWS